MEKTKSGRKREREQVKEMESKKTRECGGETQIQRENCLHMCGHIFLALTSQKYSTKVLVYHS